MDEDGEVKLTIKKEDEEKKVKGGKGNEFH